MLTPVQLRCEYAENPLAVDTPTPRLSWQLNGGRRGSHPAAYQVRIASTLEGLDRGEPDLWDTGKVNSAEQMIEYGGRKLAGSPRKPPVLGGYLGGGECCFWQVRIWDQDDTPGDYSSTALFEIGLAPEDWSAEWIGCPGTWINRAIYFRRVFTLEKPVRRARVYMAGLGWSELYVNGQRANDRVLDPAQTDPSKRILYTTDAVEGRLRMGKNAIGVVAGNGWYGGVRLLLQLEIEFSDGSREQILSKAGWPAWQVTRGPIVENSVFDGEVYDARLEKPGWCDPDYVEIFPEWLSAFGADGPSGKRVPAMLEPIRVVESREAVAISQPKPGVYVFDLGQNIAGWALLKVQGEAGRRISLRFAESLYPDGTINQENLRSARAEDVYILRGGAEETWEPRFTYHGFRYIQVQGYPGQPGTQAVLGQVVRSAVKPVGTFECGNELINRIQRMIWWTESSNLHSIPTDCPQRDERMGWLNDLAARSEEVIHNFDLARLLAKFVGDIADAQDPRTGAISDTAPFRWGRRPADPVSVCYLLIPWLLYTHYNDRRTMTEHYPGMQRWVDFLTSCAVDGIVSYSYYGDWAPPVGEGEPGSIGNSAVSRYTAGALVSTACYAYSARLLSQMARVLGKKRDATAYLRLVEGVTASYNYRFWDEAAGGYGSNNQSSNAISLYMSMVPAERQDRVVANLVQDVQAHDNHLNTGNICSKYLLEALSAAGRSDLAYAIAQQESYPSWGHMLAGGATTLWERWEHATGSGMNSHNHPMMGSVGAWFYRILAGIRAHPGGPGFASFSIRPEIVPGLDWVNAALLTVKGKVTAGWKRQGNTLTISLEVPVGSLLLAAIPAQDWRQIYEGELLVWENEQPTSFPEGMHSAVREGDRVVFNLGGGAYRFRTQI